MIWLLLYAIPSAFAAGYCHRSNEDEARDWGLGVVGRARYVLFLVVMGVIWPVLLGAVAWDYVTAWRTYRAMRRGS